MEWEPFARIFAGYDAAYGTYAASSDPGPNGKVEMVRPVSLRGEVNGPKWEAHLDGRRALGIIPIDKDQKAQWGAIDIDVYGMDHLELVRRIRAEGLPLTVCRSKSGGAHAYLFLDKRYPASAVRAELRAFAARLGFAGSEIFPKQSHVDWAADDLGTWLNLPYFAGDKTTRYAYNGEGRPLTLVGFLKAAQPTRLGSWKPSRPAAASSQNAEMEGPPCLQALYDRGFPEHTRHNGLFAIGVFARKAFGDKWKEQLKAYHDKYFAPPKPEDLADVIKSLEKREYNYKCHDPPIDRYCDRPLCLQRRYGVGAVNGRVAVTYSDLTKLDCEPPVYFLTVGDRRIRLSSYEIINYKAVQRRVMEAIDHVPPGHTNGTWLKILDGLFETIIVIPVGAMPSEEAIVRQALFDYVRRGRRRASNAQIDFAAAQWSPLIDGSEVYVNWMRFLQDTQKRMRVSRAVIAAAYKSLGVKETENPLVQKITLKKEL